MIKQHFSIDIKAPVQRVRYTMLDDAGYRKRTAPFNPAGSWFEWNRAKGSEMRFLWPHPEHPEQIGWMLAEIAENNLFSYISIKHKAEIQDGQIREWGERTDAHENYTFSEKDGITTLVVDVDTTEAFADYMAQAWAKALAMLKDMCEVPFHPLTITASIYAPLETVREKRTNPATMPQWCSGDDSWHTPRAENDLRAWGRFLTRMEAKDGSAWFDWTGTYTKVEPMSLIEYLMDDGRKASIFFVNDTTCGTTVITETFDAETMHTHEQQIAGWGHILNNFKVFAEQK